MPCFYVARYEEENDDDDHRINLNVMSLQNIDDHKSTQLPFYFPAVNCHDFLVKLMN